MMDHFRAALESGGFPNAATMELWLGGESSKPHHSPITADELSMHEGNL